MVLKTEPVIFSILDVTRSYLQTEGGAKSFCFPIGTKEVTRDERVVAQTQKAVALQFLQLFLCPALFHDAPPDLCITNQISLFFLN